jgi:hypothetical protein
MNEYFSGNARHAPGVIFICADDRYRMVAVRMLQHQDGAVYLSAARVGQGCFQYLNQLSVPVRPEIYNLGAVVVRHYKLTRHDASV